MAAVTICSDFGAPKIKSDTGLIEFRNLLKVTRKQQIPFNA